jgi:sugar lactone lactonase YvrE
MGLVAAFSAPPKRRNRGRFGENHSAPVAPKARAKSSDPTQHDAWNDRRVSRRKTAVFADGIHFAECPRWHDGALWLSDMWDHTVYRFDGAGTRQVVHKFAEGEDPGGLGWLPDGRMLVVGMEGRRVYRLEGGNAVVHAELQALSPWQCNDMIVASDGTAYVSQFGFDLWGGTAPYAPSPLIRVSPGGDVDIAAHDLASPNGVALTEDGRTLVVAEPAASRLTSFAVGRDGRLTDREVFAQLKPVAGAQHAPPDGICLDAAGAVWAAEPMGKRVVRVERGGTVTDEIRFDHHAFAVVLGGSDRRTLFVCVAPEFSKPNRTPEPRARIETVAVDVPGSGRP